MAKLVYRTHPALEGSSDAPPRRRRFALYRLGVR